ncbi:MAG: DUF4352 domain-containing protein, partial [Fusobacteriaceae bacterium]
YIVVDTTFKNISQESRMIIGGELKVKIGGKEYKFDKPETVMAEGWGLFLDQINPMLSKTTKLVFKLPDEKFDEIYYIPGRNSKMLRIDLLSQPSSETIIDEDEEGEENDVASEPVENKTPISYNRKGETVETDYFNVTLNKISFTKDIRTGNQYSDLEENQDSLYITMNITFKNTSQESRYIQEGSLILSYNGKNYTFDKSETIMADGWGIMLDQINPLLSKKTNVVYKVPKEEPDRIIYIPGRNSKESGFIIYDKDEEIKIKEEQKAKESIQKQEVIKQEQIKKEQVAKKKMLVYSEDDVYTYLIWKGYNGAGSLERFKADHGMPANRVVDERVLRMLGMEIRYK